MEARKPGKINGKRVVLFTNNENSGDDSGKGSDNSQTNKTKTFPMQQLNGEKKLSINYSKIK